MIFAGLLLKLPRRVAKRIAMIGMVLIGLPGSVYNNHALAMDAADLCVRLAAEAPDMNGAPLRIAQVVGDSGVDASPALPPSCAREPDTCSNLTNAQVLPGDVVITSRQASGFMCAHRFDGASDIDGWLPASRLRDVEPERIDAPVAGWVGRWQSKDNAATISIIRDGDRSFRIRGEAVREGSAGHTHVGRFDAIANPTGSWLVLTDSDCHLSLMLLPGSIAAIDNRQCDGMTVRFLGFYARASTFN